LTFHERSRAHNSTRVRRNEAQYLLQKSGTKSFGFAQANYQH